MALDALLARPLPRARALSKYPSVRRDLAFVVPESVTWDAMRKNYRIANAAINNVPFAKVSPRTPVQSKDFDVLTFTHC